MNFSHFRTMCFSIWCALATPANTIARMCSQTQIKTPFWCIYRFSWCDHYLWCGSDELWHSAGRNYSS